MAEVTRPMSHLANIPPSIYHEEDGSNKAPYHRPTRPIIQLDTLKFLTASMGEVSNKQILLKSYVTGFPKESDMELKISTVKLKVPEDSNTILVKNLYLSCDPYMRPRMTKSEGSYTDSFTPGSVSLNHYYFNLFAFIFPINLKLGNRGRGK